MTSLHAATRMLRNSPGVSILAAIALALGIGSTTTMYSITRGILRELPVDRPSQLMHVAVTDRTAGDDYRRIPVADIVAVREQQRTFESIAAYEDASVALGDANHRAERLSSAMVTSSLFSVLRVSPILGRTLSADDERPGTAPVAVLGHTLWKNRYASDPGVVGSTIRVNGVPTTVVGVMPDGFAFPAKEQLWTPLALDATRAASDTNTPAYNVIARLRAGVTREAAGADIATIGRRLAIADPRAHDGRALAVRPFYDEMVPRDARIILRAMLLVVSFVLLIACANVANLLLARAVSRRHEIAVRMALGASPASLVRQLLVESLAVALPGGVLGLVLAWVGITVFNSTLGFELSFWMRIQLDGGVLAFTTALVVLSAVVAGLAPARQAARVNVGDVLKDEARGSSSFRLGRASRALVVAEVALSCALLVVTGLMVKGVLSITSRYVGVAPERVATGRIELRGDAYPDAASRARMFDAVETRLASQSGVTSVALASHLPGNSSSRQRVEIGGVRYDNKQAIPQSRLIGISPAFFQTFGATLLQGRAFVAADGPNAPHVVIVNRAFAERYFNGDALGKQVRLDPTAEWATVVGVAPALGITGGNGDRNSGTDAVYVPLGQSAFANVAVAARTNGDATALVTSLREIVAALDPDVPLYQEGRLDVTLAQASAGEKVFGGLFTFFGVAALILAIVGLVGVLGFSVSRRTRELGIRIALGGRPASILWLVLRGGLMQLVAGLTIGLAIAAAVAPRFGGALFEQPPHDPSVYAAIAGVLMAAGALAAIVPAKRALSVSPMRALRGD
ncbi:MAG TPA: ABC transporter permease [Gemmatimonadaceae bacterium]|nr:ABC transporter permease [Gemmatimonadaceae bacterium]